MNSRQKEVLAAVVELYTKTAVPVGSQALIEEFDFPVSSATLRNDMALLEEEGYLYQPHVSAGRIPTDEGYRLYVSEMMGEESLSRRDQERLQGELLKLKAKHARLVRSTAKMLSALSGNLAIAGLIDKEEYYDFGMRELLGKPEFQKIDELSRVVEALDTLDERVDHLLERVRDKQAHIFIGSENPFPEISNCSLVVAPYESEKGMGLLAIIGPTRMDYAKNKSLLEYMSKLLSSQLALIVMLPGTILLTSL